MTKYDLIKNKTKNFFKIATSLTMLWFFTNCASTYSNKKPEYPKDMLHRTEIKKTSQKDFQPYLLEKLIIYGESYYISGKSPLDVREDQLPIAYTHKDDIVRIFDWKSKKMIGLVAEKEYIPTKVKCAGGTKDPWADQLELRVKDSKITRVRGLKAHIINRGGSISTKEEQYAYIIKTSDKDLKFNIQTIKLNKLEEFIGEEDGKFLEEFFFPHVSDSKTGEKNKLDFYNIPTNGSQLLIKEKCGNIIIRNKNNIYRPELYVPPSPKKSAKKEKLIIRISPGQEID